MGYTHATQETVFASQGQVRARQTIRRCRLQGVALPCARRNHDRRSVSDVCACVRGRVRPCVCVRVCVCRAPRP